MPINGKQIHEKAKQLAFSPLDKLALETYLTHTNDYLTIDRYAEHHSVMYGEESKEAEAACQGLVNLGKAIWETAAKRLGQPLKDK